LDHPLTAADIWNILPPATGMSTTSWIHGCDGKWLGRVGVFFIHRNVTTKENLFGHSFRVNPMKQFIGI